MLLIFRREFTEIRSFTGKNAIDTAKVGAVAVSVAVFTRKGAIDTTTAAIVTVNVRRFAVSEMTQATTAGMDAAIERIVTVI